MTLSLQSLLVIRHSSLLNSSFSLGSLHLGMNWCKSAVTEQSDHHKWLQFTNISWSHSYMEHNKREMFFSPQLPLWLERRESNHNTAITPLLLEHLSGKNDACSPYGQCTNSSWGKTWILFTTSRTPDKPRLCQEILSEIVLAQQLHSLYPSLWA